MGNGEPRIVVPAHPAAAGAATHLALLVAREIAGLPGVAFLAAGTDDRDGNSRRRRRGGGRRRPGPGRWRAGWIPSRRCSSFDSARPLQALGCLRPTPGTSNLLDLHLLGVLRRRSHGDWSR